MGIHYYVTDVETTGLKSGYQEMTELGIVKALNKVQLYRKIKCEYPERASMDALKVTNKTFTDLLQGMNKKDVVAEANKFFAEDGQRPAARCIIGHNVQFDRKFLFALWESVGEEFPAHLWLDTITLTQAFIDISDPATLKITKTATGKISKKLNHALELVDIPKLSAQHDAKSDSQNTFLLWRRLTQEKGIDHLPHHKMVIHKFKEDERKDIDDLDMSDVF